MQNRTDILVTGEPTALTGFLNSSGILQRRYSITEVPKKGAIPLTFTKFSVGPLLNVSRDTGITISVRESERVSDYLCISEGMYFTILGAIGLIELHILKSNPILIEEDLIHECSEGCLFARPKRAYGYVLCLERPYICRGCLDFCKCLQAGPELEILWGLLRSLNCNEGELYSKTAQAIINT